MLLLQAQRMSVASAQSVLCEGSAVQVVRPQLLFDPSETGQRSQPAGRLCMYRFLKDSVWTVRYI